MTDLDWNGSLEIEQPNFDTEFLVLAGPQGPAGTAGSFQNTYRDAWVSTTSYLAGDLVKSAGSVWLAKVGNSNVTPTEGSTWTKAVDSGVNGTNGVGVPAGGTTGQVLKKNSATNYDTSWGDAPSGGGGGMVKAATTVTVNPTSKASYTSTSSTPVDINAGVFAITVTFPASGRVLIRVIGGGFVNQGSGYAHLMLREGTTNIAGTERMIGTALASPAPLGPISYEVELAATAGSVHTYKLGWRQSDAQTMALAVGGADFTSYRDPGALVISAWAVA